MREKDAKPHNKAIPELFDERRTNLHAGKVQAIQVVELSKELFLKAEKIHLYLRGI